jgi:hypothetical protein
MMLTLFTIPKAFTGSADIVQNNALASWKNLGDQVEVILLGDDPGVDSTAKKYGFKHIGDVARNEWGTPLVNDAFEKAENAASNDIVCYCNTDIILPPDFVTALELASRNFEKFLVAGQRWDMDITESIDFSKSNWYQDLRSNVALNGVLHRQSGIDYFAYRKGMYGTIPPFAVGRMAWDNWLVKRAADLGAAIVDATDAIFIVHHDHGYDHAKGGKEAIWNGGEEVNRNKMLAEMPFGTEGYIQNAATWRMLQWRLIPASKADLSTDSRSLESLWPQMLEKITLLIENGQHPEAINELNGKEKHFGHLSEFHYVRGVAYTHLGKIAHAVGDCREVLRINPGDEGAKQLLQLLENKSGIKKIDMGDSGRAPERPFL